MNSEDSIRVAKRIVSKMTEPLHSDPDGAGIPEAPSSLRDILLVGLMWTQSLRQISGQSLTGAFPIDPALIAALASAAFDPTLLESHFARALEQSDDNPLELEATLDRVVVPKATLASLLAQQADELRAAAKQNSKQDRQVMYERWQALQSPLAALLDLRAKYPHTAIHDGLRFLSPEFPGMTKHIEVNWPVIEECIETAPQYAKAKQTKTKAAILAAAIVAKEFDIGLVYCRKCCPKSAEAPRDGSAGARISLGSLIMFSRVL